MTQSLGIKITNLVHPDQFGRIDQMDAFSQTIRHCDHLGDGLTNTEQLHLSTTPIHQIVNDCKFQTVVQTGAALTVAKANPVSS